MSTLSLSDGSTQARRGFTLLELMLSLVIFGIAIAGALGFFMAVNRAIYSNSEGIAFNSRGRYLQERMLIDLRSISAVTNIVQTTAADPITGVPGTVSLDFTCKQTDFASGVAKSIRYYYDAASKTVRRQNVTDNTSQVIMSQVDAVRFRFFDRSATGNAVTWAKGAVNAIDIRIYPSPRFVLLTGKNRPFVSAEIQLRNRKK